MKAVAVRELKNRLSAYLRDVTAGEVVLVTDPSTSRARSCCARCSPTSSS